MLTPINLGLRCKYACIYGISLDVPQVAEGVQRSLLDEGLTIHLINGKGSKVFWFLIYEVSRYHGSKEPSFQSSKAREICDDLRSKKVDENVLFGDIWSRCSVYKLTPLDEGMFKRYHYGRMLCIGDAIRKVRLFMH